jgi:hypothetical protein
MNKEYFLKNGFVKFQLEEVHSLIDEINADLNWHWNNLRAPKDVPNSEIQQTWLDQGIMRIQDAWKAFQSIHSLAKLDQITSLLMDLYGSRPLPFQTLNFLFGTEQSIHSDSIHFNSEPFRQMCGVWLALEDIEYDQGPLFYYPKSHTLPELNNEILDFEISTENYPLIVNYWKNVVNEKKYTKEVAVLKKGEGIIWDGNLLHGGMDHRNKNKTRKSMVTHFYFDGAKPWRPLSSSPNHRDYFEPEWIN